ncbi:DUF7660 family protein [Ralstonia pseudosolanacearum]
MDHIGDRRWAGLHGYYKNMSQPILNTPTWRTFADILFAARVYE